MNKDAMRTALANLKSAAKKAIVDRYNMKKAPPKEEVEPDEQEPSELDDEDLEEAAEDQKATMPDDDEEDEGMTELLINVSRAPKASSKPESMPEKRKPGRPRKQK